MNSLPLISHHLFVEAIGGNDRASRKRAQADRPPVTLKGIATALPLELLDAVQPMPAGATRQLRATVASGEA